MKAVRFATLLLLCCVAETTSQVQSTNELPELVPPYAALPPTFWEQYGMTLILSGLICVAVAGVVIWIISRPKPVPVLPPEVQARRALEALDEDKRVVFTLKVFHQCSYEEIAEITGFSMAKLKTDLHRARAEMRRRIKPYAGVGYEV